jgi:hypothetical protein
LATLFPKQNRSIWVVCDGFQRNIVRETQVIISLEHAIVLQGAADSKSGAALDLSRAGRDRATQRVKPGEILTEGGPLRSRSLVFAGAISNEAIDRLIASRSEKESMQAEPPQHANYRTDPIRSHDLSVRDDPDEKGCLRWKASRSPGDTSSAAC